MRAAYIEEYGGPDKIKVGEQPKPVAASGGMLVRVHAAGIGPWDIGILRGAFGRALPFIPSSEVAGDVVEPDSAGRFQVGDKVFGSLALMGGGTAEYAVIPPDRVALMSPKLSYVEAVAMVIAGGTAYQGLIDNGGLKSRETVLITAAAGGVGSLAVQIAVATGARVLAVASKHDEEYLKGLGVEQVFDYHDANWVEQVRSVAPDGVDLLFDAAGRDTRDQALTLVKEGGRAEVITGPIDHMPEGITGGFFAATVNGTRLEALNKLVEAGKLKPEIRGTVLLETCRIGFEKIEDGHGRGKIVIIVE